MDQRIGAQLGNYQIVEVIARGAYGIVYRAEHLHLDHSVAIKFIHAYLNTPQQQAAFRQEAQTLVKLRHPNIVRLLDFGIYEENPYLVSEYAPRGSLRHHLEQQASQPLSLRDARRLLAQIGYALAYVHSQGIVHRDLKPENILFDRDGRALLADFGIARVKRTVNASDVGSVGSLVGLGTPPYMAPEQFQGKGEPLPQSDQYAMGCIAYELLTGQLPFTADNIGAYGFLHMYQSPDPLRLHNSTLPSRIEQAVLIALAKDPAERHPDVEAFLAALGIRQLAPTQGDLSSDATMVARGAGMSGSDDPTLIKQPGQRWAGPGAPLIEPPPTETQPMQQASRPIMSETRLSPHASERKMLTTEAPAEAAPEQTHAAPSLRAFGVKHLFLVAGIMELGLLLIGFAFGLNFWAEAGVVLAIVTCICGVGVTLFVDPWVWMVSFLLFSPLVGGTYLFFLEFPAWLSANFSATQSHPPIIDWHLFLGYLLFSPPAALFYGLLGPLHSRREPITAPFVKKLTLVLWCMGAALGLTGIGIPFIGTLGLAWMVASGFIALSQVIRIKHTPWIFGMAVSLAGLLFPLLLWGLAYGAFGPTERGEETIF